MVESHFDIHFGLLLRYFKLPSGTIYEEIAEGAGEGAAKGDLISYNYVLRRSNGYFVYSTQDAYVGDNDSDGEPEFVTLGDGAMIEGKWNEAWALVLLLVKA